MFVQPTDCTQMSYFTCTLVLYVLMYSCPILHVLMHMYSLVLCSFSTYVTHVDSYNHHHSQIQNSIPSPQGSLMLRSDGHAHRPLPSPPTFYSLLLVLNPWQSLICCLSQFYFKKVVQMESYNT